jgi:hypothetical protein
MVFILKAWSLILEGIGFYTNIFPESTCESFLDLNIPTRAEHMNKNGMAKFLEDTNQGIPSQGDFFAFPFFGNVGAPLMATLNILRLNVGLSIWLWTTLNASNALDASQISTLCHGH